MDQNLSDNEQDFDKFEALLNDQDLCAILDEILQPLGSDTLSESSQGGIVHFPKEITIEKDSGFKALSSIGSGINQQLVPGPSSSSSRLCKKPYSPQEVKDLIEGIRKYNGDGCKWKKIKLDYFKDSARTENQLKSKWNHMLDVDIRTEDPTMKDLISEAKNVDACLSGRRRKWWHT